MFRILNRRPGSALLAACLLLCAARADDLPPPRAVVDPQKPRKDFEAALAGRSNEELLALVESLARGWPQYKGAADAAHAQFAARAAAADKARQKLDALKAPPPAPLTGPDEDILKGEQAAADFHAARVRELEGLRDALNGLIDVEGPFARAADAADEHLFKLRTAAGRARGALPEPATPKALDAATAALKAQVAAAREAATGARVEVPTLAAPLLDARRTADAALARVAERKAAQAQAAERQQFEKQAAALTPAQLGEELARLRKGLAEKAAAAQGDARDHAAALADAADARTAFEAVADPLRPLTRHTPDEPPAKGGDKVSEALSAAQFDYRTRLRAMDEHKELKAALVAALDEAEKKGVAHAATLGDARRMALQASVLGAEVARRVGAGDLDPAQAPDAAAPADRARLDADAAAAAADLQRTRDERDRLRAPDPDLDNVRAITAQLLARVNERVQARADLQKLAGEFAQERKDRPDADQKRLDQRAAERRDREAPQWEPLLALDRSKGAADATEVLTAGYRELIEADDRAENLKKQRDQLDALAELLKRESADVAKLRTILEKKVPNSQAARYWDGWLRDRLGQGGLPAEASAYRDEGTKLTAAAAALAKRVEGLTGAAAEPSRVAEQTKQPAAGGEVGRARKELEEARVRGLRGTGIKLLAILLGAMILPRVLLFVLRQSIRGASDESGKASPALGPLRPAVKGVFWVGGLALALSVLGYEVGTFVTAAALVFLGVAVAARPLIADVLGALVVFAERRFKEGDVVRLGNGEAARVVGVTWRSTALRSPNGLVFSVPNRKVAEFAVENLTKGAETYDVLAVTVSTDKDAGKVINVIRGAIGQCKNVSADNGVSVVKYHQKGNLKVVEYQFWWFLKDYEQRNKTRDEVFARIALGLAHEDMTGIEVTLG